jgi:hypothetical protein
VAISIMTITIPTLHTPFFALGLLFASPRAMCKYVSKKKRDAKFKCTKRKLYPMLVSREMCVTLSKVSWIEAVY